MQIDDYLYIISEAAVALIYKKYIVYKIHPDIVAIVSIYYISVLSININTSYRYVKDKQYLTTLFARAVMDSAVMDNNIQMVEILLINNEVDVNTLNTYTIHDSAFTPFILAVINNIVDLLLKNDRIDVNAIEDMKQYSALLLATSSGDINN